MNIATSLLFLGGHIADVGLATSLSSPQSVADGDQTMDERPDNATSSASPGTRQALASSPKEPAMNLFQSLMFLGGRPMTAGHNDDIDEPFPRTYGNRVASRQWLARQPRRAPSDAEYAPAPWPRHCPQC